MRSEKQRTKLAIRKILNIQDNILDIQVKTFNIEVRTFDVFCEDENNTIFSTTEEDEALEFASGHRLDTGHIVQTITSGI